MTTKYTYLLIIGYLSGCYGCNNEIVCTVRTLKIIQYEDSVYPNYTCQELEELTKDTIDIMKANVTDRRFYFFEDAIANTTVVVKRESWWERSDINPDGGTEPVTYKIAGEALCEIKLIYVNSASSPYISSYAHELAHIAQNCKPNTYGGIVDGDEQHANWIRDGIIKATTEIQIIGVNKYDK